MSRLMILIEKALCLFNNDRHNGLSRVQPQRYTLMNDFSNNDYFWTQSCIVWGLCVGSNDPQTPELSWITFSSQKPFSCVATMLPSYIMYVTFLFVVCPTSSRLSTVPTVCFVVRCTKHIMDSYGRNMLLKKGWDITDITRRCSLKKKYIMCWLMCCFVPISTSTVHHRSL